MPKADTENKGGRKLRIEIDEQLEKQLNEIKKTKWISGKGHTETVRYMAQRFQEYESLEALINRRLLHFR